jgi:hypothetical protein
VAVRVSTDTLAKLESNNSALAHIAFSLNMLFARVQRWREESQVATQTEEAIGQIVEHLPAHTGAVGDILDNLPYRTGTLLDPLLLKPESLQGINFVHERIDNTWTF